MRIARNKAAIEAKSDTPVSDLTLNGALALLTVPREKLDDSLLKSFVDNLDAQEALANALRSQAEMARRRVILGRAEQNLDAIGKFIERHPIEHDGPHPLDELWPDIEQDFERLGVAFGEEVMSDDYDRAFALAEWLHESTAEMRSIAQDWDRRMTDEPAP